MAILQFIAIAQSPRGSDDLHGAKNTVKVSHHSLRRTIAARWTRHPPHPPPPHTPSSQAGGPRFRRQGRCCDRPRVPGRRALVAAGSSSMSSRQRQQRQKKKTAWGAPASASGSSSGRADGGADGPESSEHADDDAGRKPYLDRLTMSAHRSASGQPWEGLLLQPVSIPNLDHIGA